MVADGRLVAPVRWAVNGAILADKVEAIPGGYRFSALRTKDPLAVGFATNDFVSITLPPPGSPDNTNLPPIPEPVVRFQLDLDRFNSAQWQALFPDGSAPFHFLVCAMPTAHSARPFYWTIILLSRTTRNVPPTRN